jgi:hypothetical protein
MSIGRTACIFPQRGSARRCEGHNMNRCEALCNPFGKTGSVPLCDLTNRITRRTLQLLDLDQAPHVSSFAGPPLAALGGAPSQAAPPGSRCGAYSRFRPGLLCAHFLKSRVCLRINNSLALHVTVVFTRVLYGPGPYPNQTRFARARTNSHFRS